MSDAVFNKTHYDNTVGATVLDGGSTTLTITYDATTNSYTLTTPDVSETFTPADHVGSDPEPYRHYQKETASTDSFFDIGTPSLGSPRTYHYVNGGYWQRNVATADGGFDLIFYPFTYGLPTTPSGLPQTGTAGYAIDLFGYYTNTANSNGSQVITGDGSINVDFATGQLKLSGSAISYSLFDGRLDDARTPFTGVASIASDASFSGTFSYFATNQWAGRFYGPAAEELGAVFWSSDPNNHFEGTIVGQQATSVTPTNFLLTELIADQEFPMTFGLNAAQSKLGYKTDGSWTYIVDEFHRTDAPVFTQADRVDALSSPDYDVYQISLNGSDYQLTLAKPGNSNSIIQLHYASFGEFAVLAGPDFNTTPGPLNPMANNDYFTYGITPSFGVLNPTGTGNYTGIVVGRAANNNDLWSVSGTSEFQLNFQNGELSALLQMSGTSTTGGADLAMPDLAINGSVTTWDGVLRGSTSLAIPISGNGGTGDFGGQLYGPTGEELGGVARFELFNVGGTSSATEVSVVTLGKRGP